jgi:hypothetical protein
MRPIAGIAIALFPIASVMAGAQDSARVTPDSLTSPVKLYRSPERATKLALIPGGGYVYTGEYLRGYSVWVMTVAGIAVGPLVYNDSCALMFFELNSCEGNNRFASHMLGIGLIAGALWTWGSSIRDARASAARANERQARRALRARPIVGQSSLQSGQFRAGVAIDW